MSWSFNGHGKPAEVLASAKSSLTSQRCAEPEESVKTHVLIAIETALIAFPESDTVLVEAFGSQSTRDDLEGKARNSLLVRITPA